MWVRHIIVRVRVRVSTESPLPKHKKEKKGDCCSYRQTLELSRPVIFSSHTETRVECSDARTDQAREKALASVNRSGLPIPEKERPCTAPKESLA